MMKEKSFRRKVQDRADTLSKYIQRLIQKAEERKRDHDIIYKRKLAKERSMEDHLFADKDKFVTSAYKKKLAEQQNWAKEQALRDLRDERDDVTKKTDLSDFYFNLKKNVAFGGSEESMNLDKKAEVRKPEKAVDKKAELRKPEKEEERGAADTQEKERLSTFSNSASESSGVIEGHQAETSTSRRSMESSDSNPALDRPVLDSSEQEKSSVEKPSNDPQKRGHHKRSRDALDAAKQRFLARKRAKEQ